MLMLKITLGVLGYMVTILGIWGLLTGQTVQSNIYLARRVRSPNEPLITGFYS